MFLLTLNSCLDKKKRKENGSVIMTVPYFGHKFVNIPMRKVADLKRKKGNFVEVVLQT